MPRTKSSRDANLWSSIYQGEDGYWHGRVTMGVRDDGSPDRRHVMARDKATVTRKVRRLERQRDDGTVLKPGKAWTVEQWLTHWLENIAKPSVRYKPYIGYRTAVYKHLIPGLGAHRIDRVQPEHFERLYARMQAAGLKPGTAHQVHRTARSAFGEAYKRGHITRNPVALAKPPKVEDAEVDPFEAEEVSRVLAAALTRRNGVRFVIALALGLRQGEALGLKWSRLHQPSKTLEVRKALQRRTWQHGCDDPKTCAAPHHKTAPCPQDCKRHTRACPPPCPPGCAGHARHCPQRRDGGLVEVDVKSRAGRRGIVLPDQLYALIEQHRLAQDAEREHAGVQQRHGRPLRARHRPAPPGHRQPAERAPLGRELRLEMRLSSPQGREPNMAPLASTQVRSSGQGRGRTADLPLFRDGRDRRSEYTRDATVRLACSISA